MSPVQKTTPRLAIAIVGTGIMGCGIAQISLDAGMSVVLVGRSEVSLKKAVAKITKGLSRAAHKGKSDNDNEKDRVASVDEKLARLVTTTDLALGVADAELVLEAVVERLEVKLELFEELEHFATKDCILVTNTSSFRLRDLSVRFKSASNRFAGLHFFSPVPVMKLVEIVRSDRTDQHVYEKLLQYCSLVGKTAVSTKDTHGFIVNRLLIPYLLEAMRMADRGDATIEDIDTAMKLGAAHPMGPFQIADFVGLDTLKLIADGWHETYPDEVAYEPVASLSRLVAEGKLGRKSGQGFLKY